MAAQIPKVLMLSGVSAGALPVSCRALSMAARCIRVGRINFIASAVAASRRSFIIDSSLDEVQPSERLFSATVFHWFRTNAVRAAVSFTTIHGTFDARFVSVSCACSPYFPAYTRHQDSRDKTMIQRNRYRLSHARRTHLQRHHTLATGCPRRHTCCVLPRNHNRQIRRMNGSRGQKGVRSG